MKAATTSPSHLLRSCFISIHAAREGGDETVGCNLVCDVRISIHAAREGGDADNPKILPVLKISIHAAREGGDGGNV